MKILMKVVAAMVSIILILLAWIILVSEDLPEGKTGMEAERLADKMLTAIDHDAWERTGAIQWDFGGRHQHLWDRTRHLAEVRWDDYVVLIDINDRKGLVQQGYSGDDKEEIAALCLKAWKYWANDSFWLNPISKIRDGGTTRSIVDYEEEQGLLITYNQGGVTPGDSYLWLLDEYGLPYKWKMWVSIIPVGGISTSWDKWIKLPTGAMISTSHKNLVELKISDVKGASTLRELKGEDVFVPLEAADNLVSF